MNTGSFRYAPLVESIASLLTTSAFLGAILEDLPVGVLILDEERMPVQWNRKCVELQGVVPDGSAWLRVLHPEDRGRVVSTWKEAAERGEPWSALYRVVHPDGRVVWLIGRATALLVEGRKVGYVRTIGDVTALKATQDDLQAANEKLQLHAGKLELEVQQRTQKLTDALAELDRLSYSIVHDMRAPLRTLQGFSTLLLESYSEKLDTQGRDMLKRIAEAARKQDDLIAGVLAYHDFTRGKFPLSPINLDEIVAGILGLYANYQPSKASIHMPKTLGWVLGNETLLTQTISALLNNSVKFVAPGTHPRVRVWTEQKEGKGPPLD